MSATTLTLWLRWSVWQGAGNGEENKEQELMRIMKRRMTDFNFQSIDKKE
jgi:hypothetical protein